jgi:hypothetical protein
MALLQANIIILLHSVHSSVHGWFLQVPLVTWGYESGLANFYQGLLPPLNRLGEASEIYLATLAGAFVPLGGFGSAAGVFVTTADTTLGVP